MERSAQIGPSCCAERCVVAISEGEALEERLQSIAADSRGVLQGQGLPNGSPAALVICAAAMGCVHLMKKLPGLNKVMSLLAHVCSTERGTLHTCPG